MRTRLVITLALAGFALTESAALAQRGRFGEQAAYRYGWHFNLNMGKQQAQKTGKPLMVVVRCVP